ncbi:phage baseplate assembly protein [Bradyrhizobium liaoningense]|uniref:phage baseplate assembly protein n=1 Tax=Bradyrhizobium liaoningense TaxID=43992 RepID=UPI001BA51902|nr:phage baseplate assembly protein [Bradyrhizobium liaoningense]MBR1025607.1 phage baseplate assembly protein [Bradyrhizobium liaoningense]
MQRFNPAEAMMRTYHTLARITINKADPSRMMQEIAADFMFGGEKGDNRERIEQAQNYGFTATPLPRDEQQQSGVQDGKASAIKGEAAEAVVAFMGGHRNHPVILALDDRRHRPRGLKPGENAQHDDIGQMTLLRRMGTFLLSLDSKDEKGNDVERMASLRHVEKQKQPRPKSHAQVNQQRARDRLPPLTLEQFDAQQAQEAENFKHEGESVNTEIRCTKGRIEFRVGGDVVGYYDKQNKRWSFTGEMRLGSDDASHPVYGVNGGKGMTTESSGSGAVLVNAPKPGPPTSEDVNP